MQSNHTLKFFWRGEESRMVRDLLLAMPTAERFSLGPLGNVIVVSCVTTHYRNGSTEAKFKVVGRDHLA